MRWLSIVLVAGCAPKAPVTAAAPPEPAAPAAPQRDHVHTEHGVERPDPYYWMRDREEDNPRAVYENAIQERVTQYRELKEAVAGILYMRNKLEAELEELEGEWKSPSPEKGEYSTRAQYFELKAKMASAAARSPTSPSPT